MNARLSCGLALPGMRVISTSTTEIMSRTWPCSIVHNRIHRIVILCCVEISQSIQARLNIGLTSTATYFYSASPPHTLQLTILPIQHIFINHWKTLAASSIHNPKWAPLCWVHAERQTLLQLSVPILLTLPQNRRLQRPLIIISANSWHPTQVITPHSLFPPLYKLQNGKSRLLQPGPSISSAKVRGLPCSLSPAVLKHGGYPHIAPR